MTKVWDLHLPAQPDLIIKPVLVISQQSISLLTNKELKQTYFMLFPPVFKHKHSIFIHSIIVTK